IDDGDARGGAGVGAGEIAAAGEGDAGGREIVLASDLEVAEGAAGGGCADDRKGDEDAGARFGRRIGDPAGGGHAGDASDGLEDTVIVTARIGAAAAGEGDFEGYGVGGAEAGVDGAEAEEAVGEDAGGGEERDAERDLGGHEGALEPEETPAGGG